MPIAYDVCVLGAIKIFTDKTESIMPGSMN